MFYDIDIPISRTVLALLGRFLSGVSVSWAGCQPDTCQRVYYANHTSHLDPLVIWSALPPFVRDVTRPVAARDYWSNGWIRPYIANRCFHALLLERKEIKVHASPIKFMLDEMEDKYSIILFPEGTRGNGLEIAEFKSGLFHLCRKKPELELVPIYLENMNRILPKDRYLPVPMLSRLIFGPPLWLEQGESKDKFLGRARQAIIDIKTASMSENEIEDNPTDSAEQPGANPPPDEK